MTTCCKEKAVLVAVYQEKPTKRGLKTSKNKDKKQEHHHHHHHHHHHLHIHGSKNGDGNNRRAELLSYSQHLRDSSKSRSSISPQPHKPLVAIASTSNAQQTMAPVLPVQKSQKVKKKPSCLGFDNLLKCIAVSQAKRKVKNKKKKSSKSSTKKANEIMKTFGKRTQKGTSRFFSKLMATIQKYR